MKARALGRSRPAATGRLSCGSRWLGKIAAGVVILTATLSCSKGQHSPPLRSNRSIAEDGGAVTCSPGVEGCPCEFAGDQYTCGKLKRSDGDYATCLEGISTCTSGVWGPCVGDRQVKRSIQSVMLKKGPGKRLLSVTSACADVCNPYCGLVESEPSDAVDAGGIALAPDGGLSLVSSTGTGSAGSGTTCSGLQCSVNVCGGNVKATTLKGKVYDPAGKVPLYNATVYVPVDPDLSKLPLFSDAWIDRVKCDRCDNATVRAVSVAQTDTAGSFTLEAIPAGANIPLVVQMGKWRRVILLSTVTACQDNTVTNNCTATDKSLCLVRLPRNRFDGYNFSNGGYSYVSATGANGKADIPQIAMISGAADPFQCMLLKAGLDPSEFGSYDKNPERRIHYYHSPSRPGAKLASAFGNQISGATLWNDANMLKKYDVVIPACEGDSIDKLAIAPSGVNPYRNLIDYTNIGGRVFTTHYGYVWLHYPKVKAGLNDWSSVAQWTHSSGSTTTQSPLPATIITSFPKGSAFTTWLTNVGASTTPNKLDLLEGRQDLTLVGSYAQEWMRATNTKNSNSLFVPHFTFNTPYGEDSTEQCGRVVFSDFHVSANALTTTNSCYTASECGFAASCSGSPPSGGTCTEPCATNADCSAGYSCSGTAVAGTCQPLVCGYGNPCGAGTCNSNACRCTADWQCGSESCTLAAGTCSSSSCMQDSNCGPSEYCKDATVGTCVAESCFGDWDCASGSCVSYKCACTTGSQCASGSCSSQPNTCSAATCTSDDQSCGTSEACTLGTSGFCSGDPCNNNSDCSSGKCKNGTCGCDSDADCGSPTSGRTCASNKRCTSRACGADAACRTWEHCRLDGACSPAACSASNPCKKGTCEADGKCHCSANSQCKSGSCTKNPGTCGGTTTCLQDSSCGSSETCSGANWGTCKPRSCSATNPCPSGTCSSGVCMCTKAGDCGSNACVTSGVGSCDAQSCFQKSECGASEECKNATLGNCTKDCTTNQDCPNGETCVSNKCKGCTSASQCQTENYPSSCTGSTGGVQGTCSPYSTSTFPYACKNGNLTAQEKALEFMFFDLTACVTPDGFEPPSPSSLFAAASFSPPDYVASCGAGTLPRWREIRWRADVPDSASIVFAARSGETAASLFPAVPLTVATATQSTTATSNDFAYIDSGASGAFNLADPPVFSGDVLRLTITLNPTQPDLLKTPVLLDWSVIYDCVPSL